MPLSINDRMGPAIRQSYIRQIVSSVFRQKNKLLKNYQLSVALVDDKTIRQLNKKFRNKNKITTVLSFAYAKDSGEIILGLPEIKRSSQAAKVELSDCFRRFLVHGLLHLFGHRHDNPRQSKIMEKMEDKIIARMIKCR